MSIKNYYLRRWSEKSSLLPEWYVEKASSKPPTWREIIWAKWRAWAEDKWVTMGEDAWATMSGTERWRWVKTEWEAMADDAWKIMTESEIWEWKNNTPSIENDDWDKWARNELDYFFASSYCVRDLFRSDDDFIICKGLDHPCDNFLKAPDIILIDGVMITQGDSVPGYYVANNIGEISAFDHSIDNNEIVDERIIALLSWKAKHNGANAVINLRYHWFPDHHDYKWSCTSGDGVAVVISPLIDASVAF
ncbi:hypothetical protein [Magnetospirillum sp. SS-4]|uniref:hypothetical protein n=1 Tax=Magnetospirillum sp. SS-4 TaxID=2681465 RepID=UPI0015747FBA|nr:hypothetical protein [Magnetospirillum sp. SS-4]